MRPIIAPPIFEALEALVSRRHPRCRRCYGLRGPRQIVVLRYTPQIAPQKSEPKVPQRPPSYGYLLQTQAIVRLPPPRRELPIFQSPGISSRFAFRRRIQHPIEPPSVVLQPPCARPFQESHVLGYLCRRRAFAGISDSCELRAQCLETFGTRILPT